MTFVDSPMSAIVTVLIVAVLLSPLLLKALRRRGKGGGLITEALEGADEDDHLARASVATSTAGADSTDAPVDIGNRPVPDGTDPHAHHCGVAPASRGTGPKAS